MKVKYLQLNTWNGGQVWGKMVNFLNQGDFDVLALQEIYEGGKDSDSSNFRTVKALEKKLDEFDYEVSFFKFLKHHREEGSFDMGVTVLSRFPIRNKKEYFFDNEYKECPAVPPNKDYSLFPKGMLEVELLIGDKIFHVFSVHGIWGRNGADNLERLKMSEIIVGAIKGRQNVIMSGDFNVRPNTKTIYQVEDHLQNVFKGELRTTFNMKYKDAKTFHPEVVDMIFVSPDLKVVDHYMLEVDISDHMPLVCEFEL